MRCDTKLNMCTITHEATQDTLCVSQSKMFIPESVIFFRVVHTIVSFSLQFIALFVVKHTTTGKGSIRI